MGRLIKILFLTALIGFFAPTVAMAQLGDTETEASQEAVEETAVVVTTATVRAVSQRAGQAVRNVLFKAGGLFNFGYGPDRVAEGEQVSGTDSDGGITDGLGTWANISHEFLRMDQTDFLTKTSIDSGIAGADRFVTDDILVGMALGRSSTQSVNNSALAAGVQTSEIDSWTTSITGYAAYILNQNVYFDASAGVSRDRIRSTGFGNINQIYEQKANTRFLAGNAYYLKPYADNLVVTYQVGALRSLSRFEAFTDENGLVTDRTQDSTSQVSIGGQANYLLDLQTMLYGSAVAELFLTDREVGLGRGVAGASGVDNQVDSRYQLRLTGGADYTLTDNFTLSGEAGVVAFREDVDNWNVALNIRYDF